VDLGTRQRLALYILLQFAITQLKAKNAIDSLANILQTPARPGSARDGSRDWVNMAFVKPMRSSLVNVDAIRRWIARRRIAITIVSFTLLVAFNLLVLDVQPQHPFAFTPLSNLGLFLIACGLAVRSWSAGTLHKHDALTTVGPYALIRNPLYVGSFLMMYGFALLLNDWLAVVFIAIPLTCLYWSQVLIEERNLAKRHPEQWVTYSASTPRFLPYRYKASWRNGWSLAQWLRNREHQAILGAVLGIAGICFLDWLR
jgi:protein-S-isoprenylcysteine O-methyltransferase Ste14